MRMASGVEAAGYWLPSEFLTEDDFLIDKENFNNTELDDHFCFPTDFPYDQTDHLLQKFCTMSTSPQSTLANLGSAGGSNKRIPYGAQSSMGAKYDDVGDLIYLAAGQVAKRKLNRGYAVNPCPPSRNPAQFHKQFENIGPREARGGMDHVAWAPQQGRAALRGTGAAAKKVCAGTGVFLPRRYDTMNAYSSAPRRRPVCRETAQIRSKPLMYRLVDPRLPQPKKGRDFASDHNSVLAPRHALALLQQRPNFLTTVAEGSPMIGRDHPFLPPEWTY